MFGDMDLVIGWHRGTQHALDVQMRIPRRWRCIENEPRIRRVDRFDIRFDIGQERRLIVTDQRINADACQREAFSCRITKLEILPLVFVTEAILLYLRDQPFLATDDDTHTHGILTCALVLLLMGQRCPPLAHCAWSCIPRQTP